MDMVTTTKAKEVSQKIVSVQMPEAEWNELQKLAVQQDVSASSLVRRAVRSMYFGTHGTQELFPGGPKV
jgi:hypothetical protein